jgi:hypothetical protein
MVPSRKMNRVFEAPTAIVMMMMMMMMMMMFMTMV